MSSPNRSSSMPDRPPPVGCGISLSAASRLQRSGYAALRRIACAVEGGVLHLHGCVPSHYLKQVAQALVADVDGVCLVQNKIQVVPADPRRMTGDQESPEGEDTSPGT
jgi:osmotically-inducible protein OsmY